MAIKNDTLDELLGGRDPQTVFSKDGLFDELRGRASSESRAGRSSGGRMLGGHANRRSNGYSKREMDDQAVFSAILSNWAAQQHQNLVGINRPSHDIGW